MEKAREMLGHGADSDEREEVAAGSMRGCVQGDWCQVDLIGRRRCEHHDGQVYKKSDQEE